MVKNGKKNYRQFDCFELENGQIGVLVNYKNVMDEDGKVYEGMLIYDKNELFRRKDPSELNSDMDDIRFRDIKNRNVEYLGHFDYMIDLVRLLEFRNWRAANGR